MEALQRSDFTGKRKVGADDLGIGVIICGIIGFVGRVRECEWGQTHRLLRELLLASEHRGHDATGFVAATQPFGSPKAGSLVTSKEPTRASVFVDDNPFFRRLRHQRCTSFVGHVRAATHGEPDAPGNVNNHPFASDDGQLHLVHNGVITNYAEIADKFSLSMNGDCDSEVLLRLIEQSGNPAQGLSACLDEARGSMALAVYDRRSDAVWLARNGGRELWLARLEDDCRWFFASSESILLTAFRNAMGAGSLKRLAYHAPIPAHIPIMLMSNSRILAIRDEQHLPLP